METGHGDSQRRKNIIEKHSDYEKSKLINFIQAKKRDAILKQNYELAADLRKLEHCIEMDCNLVEDYIFELKLEEQNGKSC